SVHLIDGQGGGLEMQLRPVEREDTVVIISFAPYSRESLQVLEAARSVGASTVAFTDSDASPLALAADVSVLFSTRSPSFFPSVAAAIALIEALLELLVINAGQAVAERIERAEQHLFDSAAYVPPSAKKRPSKA